MEGLQTRPSRLLQQRLRAQALDLVKPPIHPLPGHLVETGPAMSSQVGWRTTRQRYRAATIGLQMCALSLMGLKDYLDRPPARPDCRQPGGYPLGPGAAHFHRPGTSGPLPPPLPTSTINWASGIPLTPPIKYPEALLHMPASRPSRARQRQHTLIGHQLHPERSTIHSFAIRSRICRCSCSRTAHKLHRVQSPTQTTQLRLMQARPLPPDRSEYQVSMKVLCLHHHVMSIIVELQAKGYRLWTSR